MNRLGIACVAVIGVVAGAVLTAPTAKGDVFGFSPEPPGFPFDSTPTAIAVGGLVALAVLSVSRRIGVALVGMSIGTVILVVAGLIDAPAVVGTIGAGGVLGGIVAITRTDPRKSAFTAIVARLRRPRRTPTPDAHHRHQRGMDRVHAAHRCRGLLWFRRSQLHRHHDNGDRGRSHHHVRVCSGRSRPAAPLAGDCRLSRVQWSLAPGNWQVDNTIQPHAITPIEPGPLDLAYTIEVLYGIWDYTESHQPVAA